MSRRVAGAGLGAIASWIGDVLTLRAARGGSPALLGMGLFCHASAGFIWYATLKADSGRFVDTSSAWGCAAAVLSLGLAVTMGEEQTRGQWAGYVLILLGGVARAYFAKGDP